MKKKSIVWTIAGSDSGGGAGIQADLHTFQALGTYGCSVITAVTAQNSLAVTDVYPMPSDSIVAQMTALARDLPPRAIKIGMLSDEAAIEKIAAFLAQSSVPVVFDPVLVSTSKQRLFLESMTERTALLMRILPLASIVTPNIPEAEYLLGMSIASHNDMVKAAEKFLESGVASVVIKGGHLSGDNFSQDYWTNGKESFWLACPRGEAGDYHGSGCCFSAAIAAALAQDYKLRDALVIAKMYVTQAIYSAIPYGRGPAPVAHSHWPRDQQHLPFLSEQPVQKVFAASPNCSPEPLGLYPVVDSVEWVRDLLAYGVTTIQLRIKDSNDPDLSQKIADSVVIARKYNARLFINDYWELAIEHGAYGVHLGQEDLDTADMTHIKQAGLRLGISMHDYYELARAHTFNPSYMAFGPVFPTSSKNMPHPPQGIRRLQQWRSMLDYPLVAIGGIDLQRLPEVLETDVDGIAMISAITKAPDPRQVTLEMLGLINS